MMTEEDRLHFWNAKITETQHAQHSGWLVTGYSVQDVEDQCIGKEFDYEQLKTDFKTFCTDFEKIPTTKETYMQQYLFASKVLFDIGPYSRQLKRNNPENNWRFKFNCHPVVKNDDDEQWVVLSAQAASFDVENLNKEDAIKYQTIASDLRRREEFLNNEAMKMKTIKTVNVSTHKNSTYNHKVTKQNMDLSVNQASLLALSAIATLSEFLDDKKLIRTPLSKAIFPDEGIDDIADILNTDRKETVQVLNESCESIGHYLDKSNGSVAVVAALTLTKNTKEQLRNNIVTKVVKQYLKVGKSIERELIRKLAGLATGGVALEMLMSKDIR
ncbi:uncharacterized protein LOC122503195 [Leptopilina heterotoma]|uniref:uncharacterized protein LOC122503195 n=1 Tax=Leptopilina heterotoma TaxID=63436 RepID=UPI001CA85FFF|nr:uncharacterized protein LOC122503195 [Leptopilina heterotoma]